MTTTVRDEAAIQDDRAGGAALIGGSRPFAWLLIVCGLAGLYASAVISHDKIELIKDPSFTPSCSINPAFSCNSVMKSWQASVFGFSNPYVGWVAFSMLIVIGISLLAGGKFTRWWWLGLEAGSILGVGFVFFLQYSSLYKIHSLCLWCMLVWAMTILVFWYSTVQNIRNGVLRTPEGVRRTVLEFHWVVPVLWYALIILLIYLNWGSALWA